MKFTISLIIIFQAAFWEEENDYHILQEQNNWIDLWREKKQIGAHGDHIHIDVPLPYNITYTKDRKTNTKLVYVILNGEGELSSCTWLQSCSCHFYNPI